MLITIKKIILKSYMKSKTGSVEIHSNETVDRLIEYYGLDVDE
jgi:hypothetical protein